jgi:hypothetical protein
MLCGRQWKDAVVSDVKSQSVVVADDKDGPTSLGASQMVR